MTSKNGGSTGTSTLLEEKEIEYSIQDVEQHNTVHDFWTVVDGVVYDLTGMHHPGGSIIMGAAGADCSVLFHTYHLMGPEKAQAVLQRRKIGVLKGGARIEMGDFYRACAKQVRETLKDKPRRPAAAKFLFFLDMAIKMSLVVAAFFLNPATTPLWLLIVIHLAIPQMNFMRVGGQCHANGHMQLFKSDKSTSWAEFLGLCMGGLPSWALPNPSKNQYKKINKPLSVSRDEYKYGHIGRLGEHAIIHHTQGGEIQHDTDFLTISFMKLLRLSEAQPFRLWHSIQANFWVRVLYDTLGEVVESTLIATSCFRLVYIVRRLLPQGEYRRALGLVCAILTSIPASWCYLAFPCSSHPHAINIFLAIAVCKEYFGFLGSHAFFAQHKWNYFATESMINKDWGRHNAQSCSSWWPQGMDLVMLPVLWGNPKGCTPATLSFHLEHTLFPGVCYLYYPEIAPVVRQVCQEYGVQYNGLYSMADVVKARLDMLEHYSTVAPKTKTP